RGAPLPRRPAPVEGAVIARERVDARGKAAEGEDQAQPLGAVQGGAGLVKAGPVDLGRGGREGRADGSEAAAHDPVDGGEAGADLVRDRSEERRVGKEGRARWWPYHRKKNGGECVQ